MFNESSLFLLYNALNDVLRCGWDYEEVGGAIAALGNSLFYENNAQFFGMLCV